MKFGIAAFHPDPAVYFQVSYIVNVELSRICNECIFAKYLSEEKQDWTLTVNPTTQTGISHLQVANNPITDHKNKYVTYSLLMPVEHITDKNEYPLDLYIKYFFEGITVVLSAYNIPLETISKCREEALLEIVGNGKYALAESEGFTKKMSDEEFDEIMKTLKPKS